MWRWADNPKKKFLTKEERLKMLELMERTRIMCEFLEGQARKPKAERKVVGGVLTGIGNEHISVGTVLALRPEDAVFPCHRDQGVYLARGIDEFETFKQHQCKATSIMKSKDLNMHWHYIAGKIFDFISDMAASGPVAAGYAEACEFFLRHGKIPEREIAAFYFGDGAFNQGAMWEVMNWAAIHKLPILFVCINNGVGCSVPFSQSSATDYLATKAGACGMRYFVSDTPSVERVYYAAQSAAEHIRSGNGPVFFEGRCVRIVEHNANNPRGICVPSEELDDALAEDPVAFYEFFLQRRGIVTAEELKTMKDRFKSEVEELWLRSTQEPDPEPTRKALGRVFAPVKPIIEPAGFSGKKHTMPYAKAINWTLEEILEQYDNACIFGEDVEDPQGGVFGITKGLSEKFGRDRVFNTTLAEILIVGLTAGEALGGRLPIGEIQFAPFVLEALPQVLNKIATFYYRNEVPIPGVLRLPWGGGFSGGHFHSSAIEAIFAHAKMRMACPSTPYDARGLLKAAVRDPNYVLFFESIWAYTRVIGETPAEDYEIPFGKGVIRREGRHITLITYGPLMLDLAMKAAKELSPDIELEIIDLRSFWGRENEPFDVKLCLDSVKKTSRALVLHEANLSFGIGAEVASRLNKAGFNYLEAPVARVASLDTPVPAHPNLEFYRLPGVKRIVRSSKALVRYRKRRV